MTNRDLLRQSFAGLSVHRARSALTILGIVIGVAALILVVALGESAQQIIVRQIQSLGPRNIYILPGKQQSSFSNFGLSTIMTDSLRQKDIDALGRKSNVPDVDAVIPLVFGPIVASWESEMYSTMILGSSEKAEDLYSLQMRNGSFFGADDVSGKASVVVLGTKIADELFNGNDAVGQKIRIKDRSFQVVGVLQPKGQVSMANFDEAVIAPYTTVQQYILGIRYVQRVIVRVNSVDAIPGAIGDIEAALRNSHGITDPEDDDFFVQTQADIIGTVGAVTGVMTLFLVSVAAISLVVGGVGIMNIMLVSVTERTREIGLRKALGATSRDIMNQFLIEAVILTSSGGVLGIAIGVLLGLLVTFILNVVSQSGFSFSFPLHGALVGVLVSGLIGLVFGIFPAREAAKKSPIEALRYE